MEVMLPSAAHAPHGVGKIDRAGRGMRDGAKRGYGRKGGAALHQAGVPDKVALHVDVMAASMPAYAPAQPAYWPPETMYHLANVQQLIIQQVHYYFSTENLCKDEFLRVHMDSEGWLPVQLLATFNRLRHLTTDIVLLTEALKLSPELEVLEGHVRKRHDWQRWVFPASPSPAKSEADASTAVQATGEAEQWPNQMPESPAETLPSPASSPMSSPVQPQGGAPSQWRDVASKQLGIPAAPKDSAVPKDPAAARARATATRAIAATPQSTALAAAAAPSATAELPSNSSGANEEAVTPPVVSPVTQHQPESEQRLSNAGTDEDIGWETSKGKSRRRSKACQQAAAPLSTQPNQYSLTQLKSGPPTSDVLSTSNSDEANSDETIPLNEDDWSSSSAGSVEEQSMSAESSKVALRVSTSSRRKRASSKAATTPLRAAEKTGAEKLQTRAQKGSGALVDQPMHALRGRAAKREQLDLSSTETISTAKQCVNAVSSFAARVSPKAQHLLRLPATHLAVQFMLVALALVLLCFMPQHILPPTLPQLDALCWLEIPAGIALAFKLHELGGTVQALCTPLPAPSRRELKD